MQYKVTAHKCKVGSVIDLNDSMVPAGTISIGEDLFIITLEPLEERRLPEEEVSESESGSDDEETAREAS